MPILLLRLKLKRRSYSFYNKYNNEWIGGGGGGGWGGCKSGFKDCLWQSKTLSRTRIGSLAFSKMKEPIQNRDKKMGQI